MNAAKTITLLFLILLTFPHIPTTYALTYDYTDTVTHIVDGDTFDGSSGRRYRLADIDAPESNEAGYTTSTSALTGYILGKTVYVDIDGTMTYGRYVCVIYVDYNQNYYQNINKAQLSSGNAAVWDYPNAWNPYTWNLLEPKPAPPPSLPQKTSTSLSCTSSENPTTIGRSITISGAVTPTLANIEITVSIVKPDGIVESHATRTTNAGTYSLQVTLDSAGRFLIHSKWDGTSQYQAATSNTLTINVTNPPKTPTTITCNTSADTAIEGETVQISGLLTPCQATTQVLIKWRNPLGQTGQIALTTDQDGAYNHTMTLNKVGIWQINAAKEEDVTYQASESLKKSIPVTAKPIPRGGLIVTVRDERNQTLSDINVTSITNPPGADRISISKPESFILVQTGTYILRAEKEGYLPSIQTTVIEEDKITRVNFTLIESTSQIRFHITDEANKPLPDVKIQSTTQPPNNPQINTITSAEGTVNITAKLGHYTFTIQKDGYNPITRSIQLENQPSIQQLSLAKTIENPSPASGDKNPVPGTDTRIIIVGCVTATIILLKITPHQLRGPQTPDKR